jgi:hypothetical protein
MSRSVHARLIQVELRDQELSSLAQPVNDNLS